MSSTDLLGEMSQYGFTEADLKLVEKYRKQWQTGKRSERTPLADRVFKKMRSLDKDMTKATAKLKKQVSGFLRTLGCLD